jgi:hypothetical protein
MAKVVVKNLRSESCGGLSDRFSELQKRGVIGAAGRRVMYSADSSSPNFGRELERIFQRNVHKARRDNKRVLGVADRSPHR